SVPPNARLALQPCHRLADALRMASSEPSIKGSALSSVVEDVRALRDSGRISADRLETSLEAADLVLLEAKIQPALWYPIQSYARLTRLLLDVAGRVLTERDARMITALSGAIFNFTRWSYRTSESDSMIEVSEAADWPEVSMWAARGFLEYVVSRLRRVETRVEATRVAPDRIEFRFR